MKNETVYSRIFNGVVLDITHFDKVLARAYRDLAINYLQSKLSGLPNLSSEIFFWEREYHSFKVRHVPPIGAVKDECCKKSIQYALTNLKAKFIEPLKLIEVGCGPTSQFYTQEISNRSDLAIMTVDPLAEIYQRLHQQYNTGYNIICTKGYGETLNMFLETESFHLVYSQNAIDHSMSPALFFRKFVQNFKEGRLFDPLRFRKGGLNRWVARFAQMGYRGRKR